MSKKELTKQDIEELVNFHYPVLLGFDLHEGNITWKEYLIKVKEWRKHHFERQ